MILETYINFMQKILLFSSYIKSNSSFPKPLTQKEEQQYLIEVSEGNEKAKEILINHNLRLVAHIVKKYTSAGEADDLISVGSLGLIKAINTYNLSAGTQFSTYAARCIENEILMLIRVNKKHKNTISIEETLGSDEEDNSISLLDVIYNDDACNVETQVNNNILSSKMNIILKKYLSKREYEILKLRYGLGGCGVLTQREIAKKLQISRSYISRLEKKALLTLKSKLNKKDFM